MELSNLTKSDRIVVNNLIKGHIEYTVLGYGSDYPVFNTLEEAYDFFIGTLSDPCPLYLWLGNGQVLPNITHPIDNPVYLNRLDGYRNLILRSIKVSCHLQARGDVWWWKPIYTKVNENTINEYRGLDFSLSPNFSENTQIVFR